MSVPFKLAAQLSPFATADTQFQGVSVLALNPVQPTTVVCGSADGGVCLVDIAKSIPLGRCLGHERAITDISFLASDPALIVTSSRDGTVSLFDHRLPPNVCRLSRLKLSLDSDEADAWSVDTGGVSERLLACSIEDKIRLYDLRVVAESSSNDPKRRRSRATGLIWEFKDSHQDLINTVRFHPSRRSLLFSGADDDLVCIHDTNRCKKNCNSSQSNNDGEDSSTTPDDPSVVGGLHNESPPRLIRFVGPHHDVLCTISTTEIIQAWHCPRLAETNPNSSFSSIVETFSSTSVSTSPLPATDQNEDEEFLLHPLIRPSEAIRNASELLDGDSCGYIVNAIYDETTERLFALGGSIHGRLCLYHISANEFNHVAKFEGSGNGHRSIVRCSEIVPSIVSSLLVTGSEDGLLCLWAQQQQQSCS